MAPERIAGFSTDDNNVQLRLALAWTGYWRTVRERDLEVRMVSWLSLQVTLKQAGYLCHIRHGFLMGRRIFLDTCLDSRWMQCRED